MFYRTFPVRTYRMVLCTHHRYASFVQAHEIAKKINIQKTQRWLTHGVNVCYGLEGRGVLQIARLVSHRQVVAQSVLCILFSKVFLLFFGCCSRVLPRVNNSRNSVTFFSSTSRIFCVFQLFRGSLPSCPLLKKLSKTKEKKFSKKCVSQP